MKSLREWLQEELDKALHAEAAGVCMGIESRYWFGYGKAIDAVLKELNAREDAERERVNENTIALDRYAGEVLQEKEGGAE